MKTNSRVAPAADSSPLAREAACYARAAAAMEVAADLAARPPIDLDRIMAALRAARQDLLTADDLANQHEPGRAHIAGTVLAMRRIGPREKGAARMGSEDLQETEGHRLATRMREDAARIRAAAPRTDTSAPQPWVAP